MNYLYKYAGAALVTLLSMGAFIACGDNTAGEGAGRQKIERPEVVVREVTTTGFILRWSAVKEAGSYIYSLDGGQETSTTKCEIVFSGLEKHKEYVVAVKASPKNETLSESSYTYIHVTTDDMERLSKPEITLGCAYSSRTLISWTDVPEAASYEYTIDGKTATTDKRQITLTGLVRSKQYTFTLRALTDDATRFNDSEAQELVFTVSAEDVPAILIAQLSAVADAMIFETYTASNMTYYWEVVPAADFERYTQNEEEFLELCRQAILEVARQQTVSLQLALASILEVGTKRKEIYNLVQELSYEVFAFGMDLSGNITTPLCHTRIRTTANGYSSGPNYGGSDWFKQDFFISNAYTGILGYSWNNAVFSIWTGQDVVEVRYRAFFTNQFESFFGDVNDREAITEFLMTDRYAYVLNGSLVSQVNGPEGQLHVTEASPGYSYTLAALATSSGGEQTLCVNSTTTKTNTTSASWFLTGAELNASAGGPTHNTIVGIMRGVDVAACRYTCIKMDQLENVNTSQYGELVEQYGYDIKPENIPNINGGGLGIIIGSLTPATTYIFISTATNTVGDTCTRWSSVTTDAAPAGYPSPASAPLTRSGMQAIPNPGTPVAYPEDFLFPINTKPVPQEVKPESGYPTIIQNMLKQDRNS